MSINTSGRPKIPNALQNIPTQSENIDASHIICGANGNPDEIEIKGTVNFLTPIEISVTEI